MGMMLHRHYQGQGVEEPRKEPKVTEEEKTAQPKKRGKKSTEDK